MQEVHFYKPKHDSAELSAARRHELRDKTDRTQHESRQQRGERARAIQSRPQDTQDETHRDGRADVGLHAL